MAVNYMEDGTRAEPAPINAFHKSPNAVIGDGDTMVLPDAPATIFEGEAELALVIGKRATNVKAADAMDVHLRLHELHRRLGARSAAGGNTFYQMKSRDTFAPIGPVPGHRRRDRRSAEPAGQAVGQRRAEAEFQHERHGPQDPRCIEWITSIHTLEPGDVLATGTNHRGLSAFMDGDRIELETEGLGRLHFQVRDDLKRTWARETRLERQEQGLEGPTPQLTGKYAPSK